MNVSVSAELFVICTSDDVSASQFLREGNSIMRTERRCPDRTLAFGNVPA
jgi:hypothetical protein